MVFVCFMSLIVIFDLCFAMLQFALRVCVFGKSMCRTQSENDVYCLRYGWYNCLLATAFEKLGIIFTEF
jgi:hypothetical protein